MMRSLFLLLCLVLISTQALAQRKLMQPWLRISDPLVMGQNFEYVFGNLPLQGKVKNFSHFWSGSHWGLNKGNINYRWASSRIGFNLPSPSKEVAKKLSLQELQGLAPSEKFDLLNGRYDYPLRNEVAKIAHPGAMDWEGICHGWAPASMNHPEPQPKILISADGIRIPFGSSDIKGLMSFYYANHHPEVARHMGLRCDPGSAEDRCRDDMNAGAFHIVLANKMGIEGMSFIADISNGHEVWNHPAYDYFSTMTHQNLRPSANSAPGTKRVVRIQTDMIFVGENINNSWYPLIGTRGQYFTRKIYLYDLDLDEKGRIIGGEWRSRDRPDFLWTVNGAARFEGFFMLLNELSKL